MKKKGTKGWIDQIKESDGYILYERTEEEFKRKFAESYYKLTGERLK